MKTLSRTHVFFWGALKGFIRNTTISFSAYQNKTRLEKINQLETKLFDLENTHQVCPSDDIKVSLDATRSELNALLRQRAEFLMLRARRNYYFNGPRPSHLLSLKIKQNEKISNITAISSSEGILTDPQEINAEFRNFYSNLYSSELSLNMSKCSEFLENLNLPSITQEEEPKLESPITLDELKNAVLNMKRGKSPGWDGIPPEFYAMFWEELGQYMLDMILMSVKNGSFLNDVNLALLTVLPKPKKDLLFCNNYRPLSILCTEVKVYAKVLVSRIESHLQKLIHQDQTGFVKSRLAGDNIRRLLHVIHFSQDIEDPCAVLSLDAEKAFDRLEWQYLWEVLRKFGFGQGFVGMIKVLYSNPTAVVTANNILSTPFSIYRGSRQGCPLSPLLFALSLEPLAQSIRQHPLIEPITFCNTHHHISLFADDILLYVNNALTSIPHVLETFARFSNLSGYKINWTKSQLMPLNPSVSLSTLPSLIPVVNSFKYLGVDIYPTLSVISTKNFQHIFKRVEEDMERWTKLPISMSARISIIKMDVLPRINFYSNMIPLAPPKNYWDNLNKITSNFIWGGKRPRLKLSTLQRSKKDGGLNVPNFKLYSWSYIIRPISVWFDPSMVVSWRPIEENLAYPHRLQDLIFSAFPSKSTQRQLGPIMSFLLSTWRAIEKQCQISLKWHTHSPLFNNFNLTTGGAPFKLPQWSTKGINILMDVWEENGMRSFDDICSLYNVAKSSFFFYLRLRLAMRTYGVPWGEKLATHPLYSLLNVRGKTKGLTSKIYALLNSGCKSLNIGYIWSRDLDITEKDICWTMVWNNLDHVSKNPNHKLIHFKFLHRMYLTPRRLHLMKLVSSPNCDLCPNRDVGSFMHMYWCCPEVTTFWEMVSLTLTKLFDVLIPYCPKLFLLNDTSALNLPSYHYPALFASLTAAKKMLALRWQPPHSLSRTHWLLSLLDILYMELSVARMHNAKQATITSWTSSIEKIKNLLCPQIDV